MKKIATLALGWVLALSFAGCNGEGSDGDDHGHFHPEPQHGGDLLELGDHHGHVEFVHDAKNGTAHFYVTNKEGKSAAAEMIQLKLQTESGPKQIDAKVSAGEPSGSHFELTDDALKGKEPTGRMTVKYGGKTYNEDLEHDHDHEH